MADILSASADLNDENDRITYNLERWRAAEARLLSALENGDF